MSGFETALVVFSLSVVVFTSLCVLVSVLFYRFNPYPDVNLVKVERRKGGYEVTVTDANSGEEGVAVSEVGILFYWMPGGERVPFYIENKMESWVRQFRIKEKFND